MGAKTKASKMEKRIKARQVEFLAANDLTNWTKNEEDYIYARGLIQKLWVDDELPGKEQKILDFNVREVTLIMDIEPTASYPSYEKNWCTEQWTWSM